MNMQLIREWIDQVINRGNREPLNRDGLICVWRNRNGYDGYISLTRQSETVRIYFMKESLTDSATSRNLPTLMSSIKNIFETNERGFFSLYNQRQIDQIDDPEEN